MKLITAVVFLSTTSAAVFDNEQRHDGEAGKVPILLGLRGANVNEDLAAQCWDCHTWSDDNYIGWVYSNNKAAAVKNCKVRFPNYCGSGCKATWTSCGDEDEDSEEVF